MSLAAEEYPRHMQLAFRSPVDRRARLLRLWGGAHHVEAPIDRWIFSSYRPQTRTAGMESSHRKAYSVLSAVWRVIRLLVLLSGVATLYVEGIAIRSVAISLLVVSVSLMLILLVERSRDFLLWSGYVLGFVLFAHLRTLADQTIVPVRYEYIIELDRLLFLGQVPTVWSQERFYTPGNFSVHDIVLIAVYGSYFLVPHLFALVLWIWDRATFPRYVFSVLGTYYASLLGFFLIPTAPPWLAANRGHISEVYRIVQETITAIEPRAFEQGHQVVGVNDVAAVPSLHFASTLLVVLVLWRVLPASRSIGVLYAGTMGLALVYLGEHYATDIVIGGVIATGAWWMSNRWIFQWFGPTPSSEGEHARHSTNSRVTDLEH